MSESDADSDDKGWLERLTDRFSSEPADKKELEQILRDASERQIIDPETLNIIFGALNQTQVRARDIMIPRPQLVCVNADDKLATILPTIIKAKHLLPLLLDGASDTASIDLQSIARSVNVVPESQPLNLLLREFRSTRKHMALVVDEYGHISGAVTIEDVLEQIVGEIEDEYDDVEEDDHIKQLDAVNFTIKATTTLDDFNEYFDCELVADEFDTVGGILLKRFGHLPERDEVTRVDDFEFTVLSSDSRRITLLHLKRLDIA